MGKYIFCTPGCNSGNKHHLKSQHQSRVLKMSQSFLCHETEVLSVEHEEYFSQVGEGYRENSKPHGLKGSFSCRSIHNFGTCISLLKINPAFFTSAMTISLEKMKHCSLGFSLQSRSISKVFVPPVLFALRLSGLCAYCLVTNFTWPPVQIMRCHPVSAATKFRTICVDVPCGEALCLADLVSRASSESERSAE